MSARDELRAKVLATADPKPAPVSVAGWEGVHVKPLLVGQVESDPEGLDPKLRTARGLARTLSLANGDLLFDPDNTEDLKAINRLPATVLRAISDAVERLNGTSEQAAKELGNG